MAVNFSSYETIKSGLMVNERSLYVTGHNISNVNTPGYVRQQAIITTGPYQSVPTKYGVSQMGLGADIEQIRQIRHSFLDNIYRQENTTLGYWESRNKTFQDVQSILGEPMGSGIQNVMNQFWDSWQELSKDPDSLTVRSLVRQRGEALTQQLNHVGEQLDKLQSDLNSEIKVRIDEVNDITDKISQLNVQILKVEISRDQANDYRDQRNTLVDRLSKLVNAEVTEMQDGQLDITVGGYFLVNKGKSTRLSAEESNASGLFYSPKLEGTNIIVPLRNGLIKGLMESRGEVFGTRGSAENGTPNSKEDITFVIDNSNGSSANLDKIKANISNYMNELNRPGVDYNLRLVTYGTAANYNNKVYDSSNVANFLSDLNSISENAADTGNNFGKDASGVIATLGNISSFRSGADKYALVFTNESIDGNEAPPLTDNSGYINTLKSMGMKTSIITNPDYYYNGDSVGENGWSNIASAAGGKLYDINSTDFPSMMTTLAMDNVNSGMSVVEPSNNIIPDLRKRLNSLINVMAREVNFQHKSGKNLRGQDGQDFFTTIDSMYPLEMGNIKLNDNLLDLNNIVASTNTASGDNTIALKIANLRNGAFMNDLNGVISIDDYYQSTILSVGNGGQDAQRISENQMKLVQSADSYRQSIMGVSMDEEMTNMMKYKFGYDAASRCINVLDEMLDTVIGRMGLVGR